MRFFYLALILIGVLSCKENTSQVTIVIENTPSPRILHCEDILIPPILLNPVSLNIVDSFLIISQNKTDSIFYIFRLPECKYLLSFGINGKGPDEFITSFPNTSLSSIHSKNSSLAVDNKLNHVQYYRINDILNGNFTPFKKVILPEEFNGFQQIRYCGDSIIIAAPYIGNSHIIKHNSLTNRTTTFIEYPKLYPLQDPEGQRRVYGCYIAVKPDNSKFVLTYSNCGVIEIYDVNNNIPKRIEYKTFPSLEENLGLTSGTKNTKPIKDQMIFSWGVTATDEYIYARIFNDKYTNISDGKGYKKSLLPEIHVFDWSGNFIANLKPEKFFSRFDVDLNDEYLYAIDGDIEFVIQKFKIKDFLH